MGFALKLIMPSYLYQSPKWLRHFGLLKPLQGLVLNSQKWDHTFVNWYYQLRYR